MTAFRFTKIPKPNRFEYKTRFYNPEKEELQEKLRRIEKLEKGEYTSDEVKARIQSTFKRRTGRAQVDRSFRSSQARRSNIMLLAIIIILALVTYYLVNQNLSGLIQLLETPNQ
jgi:hypothetical protein